MRFRFSSTRYLLVASLGLGVFGAGTSNGMAVAPQAGPVPAAPTARLAWVGRVLAPVIARAAPTATAKRRAKVIPIAPFAQGPTTLLITRTVVTDDVRWVEVILPIRPNGTKGWIPADVLSMRTISARITIDLSDRRLSLFRAGKRVLYAPIAVGASPTPTPRGSQFAIAERVTTGVPSGFLGPFVLPLTGYSETLNEFAGGNGRVAIHGTSLPGLIGSAVSHGCVRMRNVDIVRVASAALPGTPVSIAD